MPMDAPDSPKDAPPVPEAKFGRLRFVHATAAVDPSVTVPAAGLDIYIQRGQVETRQFTNVAPYATTAYGEIETGMIRLALRAAGAAVSAAPLFISEPFEIVEGASLSIFSAGILGDGNDAVKFRLTNVVDSFPAAVAGKVHVRVVNHSHGIPALGLDLGDDGVIEIGTLDRYAVGAATGFELNSAAELGVAIKTTTGTSLATVTLPASALVDGSNQYLVIAGVTTIRPRDPRGLRVLLVRSNGATVVPLDPQINVLLGAPEPAAAGITTFDVFTGAVERFDNFVFGTLRSVRLKPTATGHMLSIFPRAVGNTRPADPALAELSTGPLEAGQQYLLVLDGLVSNSTLALHVYKDDLQLAIDGTGKLRAIHTMQDLANADFGWLDTTGVWQDVTGFANIAQSAASMPAAGMPLLTPAGQPATNFRIGMRVAGDTTTQKTFGSASTTQTMNSNDRWYAVGIGAWGGATATLQAPRVIVVKTAASTWSTTSLAAQATALRASLRAVPKARVTR